MVSCSTHGRVPSALRTRSGQLRAPYIPVTYRVPSAGATAVPAAAAAPGAKKARSERSSEPIANPPRPAAEHTSRRPRPVGHHLARKSFPVDYLEHLLGGHPHRVVMNPQQVVLQVSLDLPATRNPCKALPNSVRSEQSGQP